MEEISKIVTRQDNKNKKMPSTLRSGVTLFTKLLRTRDEPKSRLEFPFRL